MPQPDGQDSALPQDTSSLIRWLKDRLPPLEPNVSNLVDEESRLRLAVEIGKRDVLQLLVMLSNKRKGN